MLGVGLAAGVAALSGCGEPGTVAEFVPGTSPSPDLHGPTLVNPSASASAGPASSTDLPPYGQRLVATLSRFLKPTVENPRHPTFAGAAVLVSVNGAVTMRAAVGDALHYGAGPVELPRSQRVAMQTDSIFDLASITKVYTAILALQQVDSGRIDLDAPVVEYLPGFDGPGKTAVTISMLLAHTSGLPGGANVSGLPDDSARRAAVLATPLIAGETPGRRFRYSSVGLMVVAQIVEKVTGRTLDEALRTGLTSPLGLRDTGFRPLTWLSKSAAAARLVATDARSSRGLLRGVVHDQVANTLGGVAGHAGMFSTVDDVAVVGQMLLNGGEYGGVRILTDSTVRRMLTNVNVGLPAIDPDRPGRSSDHGLGVELNQPWFMGRLASPRTFGHTGFTGTSLLVDLQRRVVFVLLTNRAHPNWSWANPDPMRAVAANVLADAFG